MKYIIILSFFIFSCTTKSSLKLEKQNIDTLKYSYKGFNNGKKLSLLSNGKFINEEYLFGCTGGGERKKVFGTYKIDSSDTYLTLNPTLVELTEYPIEREMKPIIKTIKHNIDLLKIKTNYQILKWEKNRYLLSGFFYIGWSLEEDNDYIRFANYLNSGSEPESSGMYLVNKVEDSITSNFDLNQIPKKWENFFLRKPISAKIKSIEKIIYSKEEEDVSWLLELNKGENDLVNNRLTLKTKDGSLFIEIDSVLKNKSFGRTYIPNFSPKKYPVGTELRTKWE
ncbi:hypothetical protein [Tenacibaculum sp. 47A_GOM-205m]|uniref:hypothetical protein n=1 Tax=Tenacibaculum sp. 47A_GOM-205m TaxID=1380384 RepID=UPI000490F290|nr:hypothetical protein [Tenacibaculum sp. 47A_GOM-205m]